MPQKRKQELKILALAYFPSLFGNNSKKYSKLATWLVSQFGIVNYALRDTFTAGGKIAINGIEFPQIFQHLANDLEKILDNIKNIDLDEIRYYWGVDISIDDHNIIPIWKKQCLLACQKSLSDTQLSMLNDILNGPTYLDSKK